MTDDATKCRALDIAYEIGVHSVDALRTDPASVVHGWGFGTGMAGAGLFLAHLASVCADDGMAAEAERICELVVAALSGVPTTGGWADGKLGASFAAIQSAQALGRRDLVEASLPALYDALGAAKRPDVYGGLGGAILIAIRVASLLDEPVWRTRAETLGRTLLATGVGPRAEGMAVLPHQPVRMPLQGFGHGAAGCAVALAALAITVKEPAYRYVARSLLAYEDSLYRPDWLNWPDGRLERDLLDRGLAARSVSLGLARPAHPFAWCNGKGGLLTARLLLMCGLRLVDSSEGMGPEKMRDPIWRWVGRGASDHSLCCGLGGVLELHLLAARELGHSRFTKWIAHYVDDIQDLHDSTGGWVAPWRKERGDPSLGFLKGASGVGYSLLRVATDGDVVSQLLMGAETVHGTCPDDSPELQKYRKAAIRNVWGQPNSRAFTEMVDSECEASPAKDMATDLKRVEQAGQVLVSNAHLPRALAEAVRWRTRMERELPQRVTRLDDTARPNPSVEDESTRYRITGVARDFKGVDESYLVGMRGGFGTVTCVAEGSATVVFCLKSPRTFPELLKTLKRERGKTWDPEDLAGLLVFLWSLGIVRTVFNGIE